MIIGLVGSIDSGKSTVGGILVSQGFRADSFAAPLKDACSVIFGWPRHLLEGDTAESRAFRETPDQFWSEKFGRLFTPREALQLMGTEAGRDVFHKDLWIASLVKRLQEGMDSVPQRDYVITDVRHNNEIDAIVKLGGVIIQLARGATVPFYTLALEYNQRTQYGNPRYQNNEIPPILKDIHRSEWDWIGNPNIAYILFNNSTKEDLVQVVTKMVDMYRD